MTAFLDEAASAEWARPLEDLGPLQGQPDPRMAFELPVGSFTALMEARNRGIIPAARRKSPQGVALREVGLTGRFGAPTELGLDFVGIVGNPSYRLTARRRSGNTSASWNLWVRGASSAILIQEDGREQLDVTRFSTGVARLAGWLPINPSWPIPVTDDALDKVIDDEDIEARIRGEHVDAPSWASEPLRRRWSGTWSDATVVEPTSKQGLVLVMIDGCTHLREKAEQGSSLTQIPSYWVLPALVDLVARTGGRR